MAYFHCLIGGGSSGGGYELTVTCDSAFASSTITCTDGTTTLTQTCPSSSPYEVVFEIPDAVESAGYSKATKARLDSTKLQGLGWKALYNIEEGIERTIKILS